MVARRRPKTSLKKTIRNIIGSFKPGTRSKMDPDARKTGPRRKKPGLKKKVQQAVPGGPFRPEDKKNPVPGGPYKPKKGPKYMKPMKKRKK